jgi:uncharacterized membrane protein
MKTTTRDIRLEVPSDQVFKFVVDPRNLPEIWPNIVEVRNVKKSKSNEGFNFNWVYKLTGEQFEGSCETIEYHPYERFTIKASNGLNSTITWSFRSTGQETRVTLQFEYQIPASLLKRTKEEIVTQETEHELDAMLQNLKTRLELQPVYV